MENKSEVLQEKALLIDQWQQSGKSIIQFCKDENISYHTFHYWRKKLSSRDAFGTKKPGAKFIKLKNVAKRVVDPGYCEVVLTNGNRVVLHGQLQSDFIKSLLG